MWHGRGGPAAGADGAKAQGADQDLRGPAWAIRGPHAPIPGPLHHSSTCCLARRPSPPVHDVVSLAP